MLWLLLACGPDEPDRPDRPHRPGRDSAEDTGVDTGAPDDTSDTSAPDDTSDTSGDTSSPAQGTGGSGGPIGSGSASIGDSSYAYYAPRCVADAHPVDVVYTMHGSGGTGASMVAQWTTLADAECFLVIGLDSQSGRSWNFQGDVENTGALVDAVDAAYDVGRRFLHGYSAGAHWGYVVGLANSATFAGLGVYAGSIQYAEQYGVWPDGTQGPIPVAIAHGTADTTVPYSEAERALAELEGEGWPAELTTFSGGTHGYEPSAQDAAWAFWMAETD